MQRAQTIQEKEARHAGHSCRSKEDHISDVLLWTPMHGYTWVSVPMRFPVRSSFGNVVFFNDKKSIKYKYIFKNFLWKC